jgi:hypothetical protein
MGHKVFSLGPIERVGSTYILGCPFERVCTSSHRVLAGMRELE